MSRGIMLSIMALYNRDSTIFDNMVLPVDVNKEDLISNLLVELAELEILYANPVVMKSVIGFWSRKELPVWNKLVETTKFVYNPIYNFDRTEEHTDTETRDLTQTNVETRDLEKSNIETRNLTGAETHDSATTGVTVNSGQDTQRELIAGFNDTLADTLKAQTEQTLGTSNSVSGTVDSGTTSTEGGTISNEENVDGTINVESSDSGTVENVHTARLFGNIGVTTTQQMIEAERNVVKFNIADYIIDSFKTRFCLLVY